MVKQQQKIVEKHQMLDEEKVEEQMVEEQVVEHQQ